MMIVYAILIFCLLIFVHELGHFMMAKAVGIRVNEFALGMGPAVVSFRKGDTDYSLRALPIGGYCKMEGEDEESKDEAAFNNKPFWAKALVVIAGSTMNLILAILILAGVFLSVGIPSSTIQQLVPGNPAEAAGLLPGDKIVRIDDREVKSWEDVIGGIESSVGDKTEITVLRDGKSIKYTSTISVNEEGRKVIGIMPAYEKHAGQALVMGAKSTFDMGGRMVDVIGQLFTGEVSTKELTGPVGIVYMVGDTAKLGFFYVAQLTALISLNLAIVNMLPFPALDGGRLLFMIIRVFTGRAISDETEGKIHMIGIMLLFGLMIYITFQDVGRFIL